jgi:hypothetical protein
MTLLQAQQQPAHMQLTASSMAAATADAAAAAAASDMALPRSAALLHAAAEQQQAPDIATAAAASAGHTSGFTPGTPLRMWERNSRGTAGMHTIYDLQCMDCLSHSSSSDVYLVRLTTIHTAADPQRAAAAAAAATATAAVTERKLAAAARQRTRVHSLQVGRLYVLKVCANLRSPSPEYSPALQLQLPATCSMSTHATSACRTATLLPTALVTEQQQLCPHQHTQGLQRSSHAYCWSMCRAAA